MKVLIIYDSVYGNTEQIARAIGNAIGNKNIDIIRPNDLKPEQLTGLEMLIVGSPTQGGRPTPAIKNLLKKIPGPSVRGINAAAFDTRLTAGWVRIFGYAAGKITDSLKRKGAVLIVPPEGFFVKGKEGPLKPGELERAAGWAKGLVKKEYI